MGKLEEAARAAGEPVETFIPRIVEEEGTVFNAAVRLGVYPNTIKNWMKRNNYQLVLKRTVEKVEPEHA